MSWPIIDWSFSCRGWTVRPACRLVGRRGPPPPQERGQRAAHHTCSILPSSVTVNCMMSASSRANLDAHDGRVGVAGDIVQRLGARRGRRADRRATCQRPDRRRAGSLLCSAPAASEQVVQRRLQAERNRGWAGGSRRGRRQPARDTPAAEPARRRREVRRRRRRAPAPGAVGDSGVRPKATPVRSWTMPSCRLAAMRRCS